MQALSMIDSASSTEGIVDLLAAFARRFDVSHVLMVSPGLIGELDPERDLFGAMPPSFIEPFLENRSLVDDALVHVVRMSQLAVVWQDDTPWEDAAPTAVALKTVLKRSGLDSGMAVPSIGGSSVSGVVVFAGQGVQLASVAQGYLKLLSVYAYDRAARLKCREIREVYNLSEREYECLRWCAAGKTDWEIGHILTISPKTVNYHIEKAKRKMSVQTRVQGVVAALLAGGIDR